MFKLLVAIAACAALAPVAGAAPTNAKNALLPITIVCPSGTYKAVVNGNGEFTPAHAVDSNTILIPIAFGEFTGTFTDAEGKVSTETDPPSAKGNAVPANGRVEDCTYSFVVTFLDGSSFAGRGSVTGFIPAS